MQIRVVSSAAAALAALEGRSDVHVITRPRLICFAKLDLSGFRYIFSLALADLLVIITCVPFTSMLYTLESWPWGVVMCKVSETSRDISIGVSVFTLTALSAERYCAIVNPLRRLQVSGGS